MTKLLFLFCMFCLPAISSAETTENAKIEKEALAKMQEFAYIITEVGKSDKVAGCKSTEEKRKLIRKANHLFINGMDGHFMIITSQRNPKGKKIAMLTYLNHLLNQSKSEASMPIYTIKSIKINTRDKRFVRKLPDGTKEYVATAKYTLVYTNVRTDNAENDRRNVTTEQDVQTMEIHIFVPTVKDAQPEVML